MAKLSISVPFGDSARTNGSSAATGIDVHDTVTFGGLGCADGDAAACEGDGFGLGVAVGVGDGIAGDTMTSAGEGVWAMWPVGPALPHEQRIVAIATATPIPTRFMHHQR